MPKRRRIIVDPILPTILQYQQAIFQHLIEIYTILSSVVVIAGHPERKKLNFDRV